MSVPRLTPRDLQLKAMAAEPAGKVPVDQAIFTSARTTRKDGYQLVAWSPGISAEDARLLAVWGPAHDSMLVDDPADVSINFHPLGENKYCVSRTMLGSLEYSGRGGLQVYTHCFILSRAGLLQFHNDPFRVLIAALAIRDLRPGTALPTDLSTLQMLPCGPAVQPELIEAVQAPSQQQAVVAWMHHVLSYPKLIFAGGCSDSTFMALFNLLPVAVRPLFTFSTRLRYSPRREFRLIGLVNDTEEQKKAARHEGCPIFSWDSPNRSPEASRHPWATWIQVALCQRNPKAVAERIGAIPLETTLEDLRSEGNRLRLAIMNSPASSTQVHASNDVATLNTVQAPNPAVSEPELLSRLLALIEKSLEGDLAALEQFHQHWQTLAGDDQAENRLACAEHFGRLFKQRKGTPGSTATAAVEILILLLGAARSSS